MTTSAESFDALAELALDLRYTWSHSTDSLWRTLEPELWNSTRNPWVVLQTASRKKLEDLQRDPKLQEQIAELLAKHRESQNAPKWFQRNHPNSPLSCVAYFSMEFGLSEALPIYSGGLGNVAGDQLKAADDLGVPLVGVGLLYQQGYFRQIIEADGSQRALFPYNDPGQLPISAVRDADGEWLRLSVVLPGVTLWIRIWQAQVGRLKLYLLDSNDPGNPPAYRGIASELYGGGPELRIAQEMILGLGGWRMLKALGLHPEVCHLNEGHAAFAVLERARDFAEDNGVPFEAALAITRSGNLFTTHTPVEAGFDRFPLQLMQRFMEFYARERLHIDFNQLLALGRANPEDNNEPFNMAYLAIRGSRAINAVSRLHSEVSRRIFARLFPRWPDREIPVSFVTNGVHTPTWDSAAADALWTKQCDGDRWRGEMESVAADISRAPDSALWEMRKQNRLELVLFVRERMAQVLGERGSDPRIAAEIFHPDALTLGFARRFATYKRPNLLLHDPDRLARILTNPDRPVQLVVAGKAHPEDLAGQAMIRAWMDFNQRPEVRRRVVFLSDYDLLLAERLVQGADLWINTPRRPWEACGTSGMKVLVNGGLNLSELDGWWAEAYSPELGWALGDGMEHNEDPKWDATEAEQLYSILEQQVIPCFYHRDAGGIPSDWVAMMRRSMAQLTPRFSANRAVREYTERYYLPAAEAYGHRAANRGEFGKVLLEWKTKLALQWPALHFGELRVASSPGAHSIEVDVNLGQTPAQDIDVQLYSNERDGAGPFVVEMHQTGDAAGDSGGWKVYAADIPLSRELSDYTPRIVAKNPDAAIPLEDAHILWFR